ncbi:MAG: SDR family NAD(P)-dependent oxidoreductase [Rectinemataceae bacterium]
MLRPVEPGGFPGKTVLVTGASSGIGLAAAELFARCGARVIAAGRDPERMERAGGRIAAAAASSGAAAPRVELVDLSLMTQVVALAERLRSEPGGIDAVANVAGWYGDRRILSPEGLELQWAVNHMAPFALAFVLLPGLSAPKRPRFLVVSSDSHYFGRIRWRDPSMRHLYVGILAYAQSKLANVLFTRELQRREGSRLDAFAVDPGLVNTDMGRKHSSPAVRAFWALRRRAGTEPGLPASHIVSLALSPDVEGRGGLYWRSGEPIRPSPAALDDEAAGRLWKMSEESLASALVCRSIRSK